MFSGIFKQKVTAVTDQPFDGYEQTIAPASTDALKKLLHKYATEPALNKVSIRADELLYLALMNPNPDGFKYWIVLQNMIQLGLIRFTSAEATDAYHDILAYINFSKNTTSTNPMLHKVTLNIDYYAEGFAYCFHMKSPTKEFSEYRHYDSQQQSPPSLELIYSTPILTLWLNDKSFGSLQAWLNKIVEAQDDCTFVLHGNYRWQETLELAKNLNTWAAESNQQVCISGFLVDTNHDTSSTTASSSLWFLVLQKLYNVLRSETSV